jgi:hypothetical protein
MKAIHQNYKQCCESVHGQRHQNSEHVLQTRVAGIILRHGGRQKFSHQKARKSNLSLINGGNLMQILPEFACYEDSRRVDGAEELTGD